MFVYLNTTGSPKRSSTLRGQTTLLRFIFHFETVLYILFGLVVVFSKLEAVASSGTSLNNSISIQQAGSPGNDSPTLRSRIESDEGNDPMIVTGRVTPHDLGPGQSAEVELQLSLPPGFHAYEDQFYFEIVAPAGFLKGALKIDPIHEWYDKFSKRTRRGVEEKSTLKASIEAPVEEVDEAKELKIRLTYQACTEKFCQFPATKTIVIPFFLAGKKTSLQSSLQKNVLEKFSDSSALLVLLQENLLLALLFVFLAGVLTSFTPCIFPMIPITLAILGHHSAQRRRSQNFLFSLTYVFGIASTYSVMGIAAASSGGLFGASLGNPWVLSALCLIFLAMSLSMFGVFEIQTPLAFTNRISAKFSSKKGPSEGLGGAYVMGLIAGIVASPCVGPVLVSILSLAAASHNRVLGFVLLFTYAFGMGMLFILLGLSSNISHKLPKSGPWMEAVKFCLGSLMLVGFYYYLHLLLPTVFFEGSLGLGLIILGGAYFETRLQSESAIRKIANGLMLALIFIGSLEIVFAVNSGRSCDSGKKTLLGSHNQKDQPDNVSMEWHNFSTVPQLDKELSFASSRGKPVLIDFWAEWCAACHELEEKTFSDSLVAKELSNYYLLKFDATQTSNELSELKTRFKIQGLPTLIFFDSEGKWKEKATLTKFENPAEFLNRLKKN